MSELKLSDFKIFERDPNQKLERRAITDLIMKGVIEEEKTYGPVFTVRFIKNALDYEAKKTGEKPPEDIKTLNQLVEYLASKADKYPEHQCTVAYAQIKAENEFQGQTGAGTHIEIMSLTRKVVEAQKIKERNVDVDTALSKFSQTLLGMKIHPDKFGYKKNEDGSVDILLKNCYYLDSCTLCFNEGLLKRPDGRQRCGSVTFVCRFLKLVTGYEWDYETLETYKPHCIIRCFMI